MTAMQIPCPECDAVLQAESLVELEDAFIAHARSGHDVPYPDDALRNYVDATQRLTGAEERLDEIGAVRIVPIDDEHLEDWLAFFDHDAFVGTPEWAACYCLEPHVKCPGGEDEVMGRWCDNRAAMVERIKGGRAFGYLAYVDGRAVGWVNASRRSDYTLYQIGSGAAPADSEVIGVSCFVIAPPYRRHGVASQLLDRVIADAPARGASAVEAYPFIDSEGQGAKDFRGPRSIYDQRGFTEIDRRSRDAVVRLSL